MLDIETQCIKIRLSIVKKLIENFNQPKPWKEIKLNNYRDAKQGILNFKNILSSRTGKKPRTFKHEPTKINNIYNEPLFYNQSTQ